MIAVKKNNNEIINEEKVKYEKQKELSIFTILASPIMDQ